MNAINRQKFLAELAKLLSFMYEEDRQYALDMYERMFDIAEENEQWLIQNLMSPTRQAVIIARSYDAKERKLSVSAQWKEEDGYEDEGEETPPFVLAINKIFDDLFPEEDEPQEQNEDQISFSDLTGEDKKESKRPKMPKAAVLLNHTQEFPAVHGQAAEAGAEEEGQEGIWTGDYEDLSDFDIDEETAAAETVKIEYLDRADFEEEETERAAEQTTEPETEKPEADSAESKKPDPEVAEAEPKPVQETAGEPEKDNTAKTVEEKLETAPQPPAERKKRRSIEELLGFKKEKAEETQAAAEKTEKNTAPANEPAAKQAEDPAQAAASGSEPETKPIQKTAQELPQTDHRSEQAGRQEKAAAAEGWKPEAPPVKENQDNIKKEAGKPAAVMYELPEEKVSVIPKPQISATTQENEAAARAWNTPMLILFLVAAIPLTLVALAILVIPTVLFFGLSIGLIALGTVLVVSAFSGFAVLADIMLLLGAAAVSMGLGLLFLWLSFWMIGEVMTGLVRWVRELAETTCYKEVSKT